MEHSWNYRVLRFTTNFPKEPFYLEIKEVYYEDDKPIGYVDICVMGETLEGLTWTLDQMKEALEKPIINANTILNDEP